MDKKGPSAFYIHILIGIGGTTMSGDTQIDVLISPFLSVVDWEIRGSLRDKRLLPASPDNVLFFFTLLANYPHSSGIKRILALARSL